MSANENLIYSLAQINSFLAQNVDRSSTSFISIDYSANYVYILSDYYGWPLFIDQAPLKKLEIYDYFLTGKKDVLIFTFLNKKDGVRNFYNKNLNIDIKPEDISLLAVFPIRVNRVASFFDVNSLFNFRRLFPGYSSIVKE